MHVISAHAKGGKRARYPLCIVVSSSAVLVECGRLRDQRSGECGITVLSMFTCKNT